MTLGADVAAVGLDDVLDDGQAQTGASLLPRSGGVDTVEALEDARERLLGNARTVIDDRDFDGIPRGIETGGDGDVALGAAVLDGVVDEVDEHLLEAVEVGADGKGFGNFVGEGDEPGAGAGGEVFEHAGCEGAEVAPLAVDDAAALFELGDGEKILDEEGEPVGVLLDGLKEFEAENGVVAGSIQEGFDVAFDDGDGCAEFVAHVGDEFAAGGLEFLEACDVVEDEDDPALRAGGVLEGGGVDFQAAGRGTVEGQFQPQGLAFGAGAVGEIRQFVASKAFQQGAAVGVRAEFEEAFDGLVDQADAAFGVEDDEALDHAIEDHLTAGMLLFEFATESLPRFAEALIEVSEAGPEFPSLALPREEGCGQTCEGEQRDEEPHGGIRAGSRLGGLFLDEPVANTPHGVEIAGGAPQLFAKPPHVGVHGPGVDDVVVLPDVLEQLIAGLDASSALHEGREELELGGGEFDAFAGNGDKVSGDVEGEVADLEVVGLLFRLLTSFDELAHAQDEFAGAERFGDVVVGAQLEAKDAVNLGGLGSEHNDRDAGGGGVAAQEFADLEPVDLGEHDVEEDEIRGLEPGRFEGRGAVVGGDDIEAGGLEIE